MKPKNKQKQGFQAKTEAHNRLFGLHAVRAAWDNPARKISRLWVSESHAEDFTPGKTRPKAEITERARLDKLSGGAVHQGVIVEVEPLEDVFLSDVIIQAETQDKTTLVMLDQVTDPHNIGAILRSCSAFGAAGLILQKRHAPEITGTLAKTASGAVEHIPILREVNLSRTLDALKDNGFTCIGLDERGENTLGEIEKSDKSVIVLGAEGTGLRHLVGETCDHLARLPTGGPIASLNVSNAAAVALYEISR